MCGEFDTKHHRLCTCKAMTDVRQDHAEIVTQVQHHYPWWAYLLAASEPEDAPFLRLVCGSRSLPPLVAPPQVSRNVFIFTDGAHNGTCPEARLTYWSVVHCHNVRDLYDLQGWDSLPLQDKVAGFRVVAQGCTPRAQTVPRAEVAAVVWAANWALQDEHVHAIIFTDSQYAIDQWGQAQSGIMLGQCGSTDLMQHFPVSPRIELRKAKAHNAAGREPSADVFLRWSTMGNEVADAAARMARTQEMDAVVQASDSIAADARFQLDHLLAFSRYLIELNVAVIDRMENLPDLPGPVEGAESIGRAVQEYFHEWNEYSINEGISPNVPSDADQRIVGQPAEQEYDRLLLHYLQQLIWPCRPQMDECPLDVTYMELFVVHDDEPKTATCANFRWGRTGFS